jgi:hypothetical protein
VSFHEQVERGGRLETPATDDLANDLLLDLSAVLAGSGDGPGRGRSTLLPYQFADALGGGDRADRIALRSEDASQHAERGH